MKATTLTQLLFSIGAIQVLIILVNVGRSKILAEILGPAGFGVISTIDQIVTTLVQLSGLSLPLTALKFMARAHSEGNDAFQRTYAGFLKTLSVLGLLTTLLALGLLQLRPGIFGPDLAKYQSYIRLAIFAVPANLLNIFFIHTLASAQRSTGSVVLSLVFSAAVASAALVGVAIGGISGLYIGTAGAGICVAMAAGYVLGHSLDLPVNAKGANVVQGILQKPELVFVSFLLYTVISVYGLTMFATRYLVLSYQGEAAAGWLQASFGISLTVGAILGPMNNLYLMPLVNRQMPVLDKFEAANSFARRIIPLLMLVSLPLALFPRFFTTLLYSSSFHPVAVTLSCFIAWQCLFQIVNIYQQLLVGLDDVLYYAVTTCAGFGAAASLFPLLIPPFGLGGAAVSLAVGSVLTGIATGVRISIKFSAPPPIDIVLLSGFCVGGIALTTILPPGLDERTAVGVVGRAGYVLAMSAALWLFIPSGDRHFFAKTVSSTVRRLRRPGWPKTIRGRS